MKNKITRRNFLKSAGTLTAASIPFGVTAPFVSQIEKVKLKKREKSNSKGLKEDLKVIDDYSQLIKKNLLKKPEGKLRYPYLTPGQRPEDRFVDWDAIWSGMSYLIDGDPEPLKGSLLNILSFIDEKGKGARVLGPNGPVRARAFTKRPFMATGAFVLSREIGSVGWLSLENWEKLHNLLLYWHRYRKGAHGLLKWLNVNEGFADNGLANWSFELNTVEAVDLNAQMILEHTAAAWIADKLGRKSDAKEHRNLANRLTEQFQKILWSKKPYGYFSCYNPSIKVKQAGKKASQIFRFHYTNFWPLWLGIVPKDQAHRIIETYILNSDHFWSKHGIRSMSKSEKSYNNARQGITVPNPSTDVNTPWPTHFPINSSNWQGPIWSIFNYLMVIGLWQYGYQKEAEKVARRIVHVLANDVRKNGDKFHRGLRLPFYENYDAETGEGNNMWGGVGFGSWHTMIRFLAHHISNDNTFILRGLDLPKLS